MALHKTIYILILLFAVSATGCSSSSTGVAENTPLTQLAGLVNDDPASGSFVNAASVRPQSEKILNDSASGSLQLLHIKHHMVECEGYLVTHCLLALREGAEQWHYIYDHIEGFEFQWGTDYELLVQVQDVESALQDTSQRRYVLIDVISESRGGVGEVFHYTARNTHERIREIADGQFSLLDGKEFTCNNESCDSLRAAIMQNQSALLAFKFEGDPGKPLLLETVVCSDAAQSFTQSCL